MPPKAHIFKSNGLWNVNCGGSYPMVFAGLESFDEAQKTLANYRNGWFVKFAEIYSAMRCPVVH